MNQGTWRGTTRDASAQAQSHPHIGYLDGWRGIAILLVLQGHFTPETWLETDRLGVDIFFGLSGLLMSRILFTERQPLARFYKRRASRILPAFLLFVACVYGVAALFGDVRPWGEIAATALFLRTYLPATPDIWNTGLPIGHLWSLNVEEHCYALLGILTLLPFLRGREAWVLGMAGIGTMVVFYAYSKSEAMHGTSFELRTEVAASFLLVSAAYHQVRGAVARFVRPWMPIAAIGLATLAYVPHARWWWGTVVAPIALAFAVNHLAEASRWLRSFLAWSPLRIAGLWSYSLYLWQQPFYMYQFHLPPGTALVGVVLAGMASYYLWERPWRLWINSH